MLGNIEYIRVDDNKLDSMSQKVWCDVERPIVVIPVEYKLRARDSSTSGYLMLTRGALYVFKKPKLIGQPDLVAKFHPLDVRQMNLRAGHMVLEFDDFQASFKGDDLVHLATAMLVILKEATFGIKDIVLMNVNSEVPLPSTEVTQRPEMAIKWRALLLAHFYDIKGEQLYTIDYFQKWEDKQKPLMILGPSFHPGNFAPAFGHAIGWESKIDSVCFQGFAPTKFARMLDCLLENSYTIKRLVFSDFKPKRVGQFAMNRIGRTSVESWWFIRCCKEEFLGWAEHSKGLPEKSINELMLHACPWDNEVWKEIPELVRRSPPLSNCRLLEIGKMTDKPFQPRVLTSIIEAMNGIQKLVFKGNQGDGSDILMACCKAQTQIRSIEITLMPFHKVVQDVALPASLLALDISQSAFTSDSLKSVLELIVRQDAQYPIVLKARGLIIKPQVYQAMATINLGMCRPNIAEVDWSENTMSAECAKFLFAYLFTQQARLRLVALNNCSTDNPVEFMKLVLQLATAIPLSGLEFSNKYDKTLYAQFIGALGSVTSLRKLNLSHSGSAESGMGALNQILPQLPNLNELNADGFLPENPAAIAAFWTTVSQCPQLVACDMPNDDFRHLGLTPNRLDPQTQKALAIVKSKDRPTCAEQRVDYTIQNLQRGNADFGPEIFRLAPSVPWHLRSYTFTGHGEEHVHQLESDE